MDVSKISLAQCAAGGLLALHGLCEQQGESRKFNASDLRELLGYGALSCIMSKYAPEGDEEGAIHWFNHLYKESGFAVSPYEELIPAWSLFNQREWLLK